jgi:low temperature requirement protein LtrA
VGRSIVIFWLLWWAWTQFTWTLSPADTQHPVVRGLTLAATAAAFVMAASITEAFRAEPLWFVVPYIVIRTIGLGLQVWVDQQKDHDGISMAWVYASVVGLGVVLAGGLVDDPARTWVWVAAIAIDLVAASLAGGHGLWDLNAEHFSERHGLFVIIALGESLIVAGRSVASEPRTTALVLSAGGVITVACLLWWTYFAQLKEAMEEAFAEVPTDDLGTLARDAYSLGHFPLIGGIVAFAVGAEHILHHPDEAASGGIIAALAVGVALFVGASAYASWRTTGRLLVPRLIVTAVAMAGVAVTADASPGWPLGVIVLALLVVVVIEELTTPDEQEDELGEARTEVD